ncbi:sodium:proton antiporter [Methanolobus halotolerans]|uniref:Sodium:proton antiporter n=1 Tax=Methanolobus halotolerans TaxID=2052935 RepID=A0A4E0PX10_9EURY|nr:sodium:proton antiporter [Methanolobus halotolerans]TGC07315.1 sodium:proton antiporter [Methanolobus halotolerans]
MDITGEKGKVVMKNLKYLNDSVMAILLLMPVTLVITFEALDSTHNLKILSLVTWVVYLIGLWYVASRVFKLNKTLIGYLDEE